MSKTIQEVSKEIKDIVKSLEDQVNRFPDSDRFDEFLMIDQYRSSLNNRIKVLKMTKKLKENKEKATASELMLIETVERETLSDAFSSFRRDIKGWVRNNLPPGVSPKFIDHNARDWADRLNTFMMKKEEEYRNERK